MLLLPPQREPARWTTRPPGDAAVPAPRTTVRPAAGIRTQLSTAEIALLREKLVREQAARPAGTRTSGRPPARRTTATGKPSKRTTAARRKAVRTAARAERGRRWSRPLVVAPVGIL